MNVSEPSMTPRQSEPQMMEVVLGCRASRCEAAGGDQGTCWSCEHRRPRGIDGTLPGWILRMWNVETPSRSGTVVSVG